MLSKEDRDIIFKIGRYKHKKMKEMNLSYEEFLEYERQKAKEKTLKEKIGYREFNKMKELGLNYEQYKQYCKEQKFKKYEKKREKDKIRFRTIRYIERYCDLKMRCQVCNSKEDIEIHHPNYNDYLKVNILCKEHHRALHNFELIPPSIIDLEEVAVRERPQKEKQNYIKQNIKNIRQDILEKGFSYKKLSDKYQVSDGTIKRYLSKEKDWLILNEKLKGAGKKANCFVHSKHKDNLIQKYRLNNNLTVKELSKMTGIPSSTIAAIENGRTRLSSIKPKTKQKLDFILTPQPDTKKGDEKTWKK